MIIHGAMTVWLLCLLGEARGVGVDLGGISYGYSRGYDDESSIYFHNNVKGYSMKLRCAKCVKVDGARIYCDYGALVNVTVDLYKGDKHVYAPFNVSCHRRRNGAYMSDISASAHPHSIELSWRISDASRDKYIVHLVAQGEYRYTAVTTRSRCFLLEGLKERTEYRICVAIVDERSETVMYRCVSQETDSLETGPVEGVTVTASITSVEISWRKPHNDLYAPSSYTVDYRETQGGSCGRIVVTMGASGATQNQGVTPPGCVLKMGLTWTELRPLTITDLLPYTLYDITILPVNRRKKQVAVTRSVTLLAKPDHPSRVKVTGRSTTTLSFTWPKVIEDAAYGPADRYEVHLMRSTTVVKEDSTTSEGASFAALAECSEHCVTVYGANAAGRSEVGGVTCAYTLAPGLGAVEVRDIESGPGVERKVAWRYSGRDACPRSYKVVYENKHMRGNAVAMETNGTSITLGSLARNTLYTVAVRAETRMDTEGGAKEGAFSAAKEFYTGSVVPGIHGYKADFTFWRERINISWGLDSLGDGSVFEFVLRVKNASDSCISTTHFLCRSCPPPYRWVNLDNDTLATRQRLLSCSPPSVVLFTRGANNLHRSLDIDVASTNFTVEIYAINLVGVHLVCGGRNACRKSERDSSNKMEAAGRSSTSIIFRWPRMSGDRPPVLYEVQLMKAGMIIKKSQSVATEASFEGLAMCNEYCVTVYRVVTPGKSLLGWTECQYTLAPSVGEVEVDKIESGPFGDRVVTWRYTGRDNCTRSYAVKYGNKHMKARVTHLDTNSTNVTLKNLDKDAVYTVEVGVQASVTTAGHRKVSEAKEFYTGEVTPRISGFEQHTSFIRKVLKVSWRLDPSYDGSVFEFIVRVTNGSDACILSAHLSCHSCPPSFSPENLDDWHKAQRRELLLCSIISKGTFKKDDSSLHHIFETETPLTNFSVEIFATNLMGVHRVYGGKSVHRPQDEIIATIHEGGTSKKVAFFASSKRLKVKGSLAERAVLLERLVTNVGNAYNNGTGEFRAPVSGVYVFAVTISAPRAAQVAVKLIKDTEAVLTLRNSDSQSAPSSIQIILEVRKNGRVWLQYDDNTPLLLGQMLSTFSGYLLFDLS